MNQNPTLPLHFEESEQQAGDIELLQLKPPPPTIAPLRLGRRRRFGDLVRRTVGNERPWDYELVREYPPLHGDLVGAMRRYLASRDDDRIGWHWRSLRTAIQSRAPPARRQRSELERGTISDTTPMYVEIVLYQHVGEGLEAERQALQDFETNRATNIPATRPATPWRDALHSLCSDAPGMGFDDLERRLNDDYERDFGQTRQQGRNRAEFRDPYQLMAQGRWTQLSARLDMDIQWLDRHRTYRDQMDHMQNRLMLQNLEQLRAILFVEDENARVNGWDTINVTVQPVWLAPNQDRLTIVRMVVPE